MKGLDSSQHSPYQTQLTSGLVDLKCLLETGACLTLLIYLGHKSLHQSLHTLFARSLIPFRACDIVKTSDRRTFGQKCGVGGLLDNAPLGI